MSILYKIIDFLKKNWQIITISLLLVIAYVFYNKQQTGFAERLKELNDTNSIEIKKINDANDQLQTRLNENEQKLEERLIDIESQYQNKLKSLQQKQVQVVKHNVEEYTADPGKLNTDIESMFGIKVIK